MENNNAELSGDWLACKSILCIRADHMGDLLMSTPAIAALKNTFGCEITVLTSPKAAAAAKLIPDIDKIIIADLPWMKLDKDPGPLFMEELIGLIGSQHFDGCVIFSVYSQHTLPAAMMAYLAKIPLRLAWCRENPYHLLSHWVPDPEPYFYIIHQVERDLDLVRTIGAVPKDKFLRIRLSAESLETATEKAERQGIDLKRNYIILHPGVSEKKREYPEKQWIDIGKLLVAQLGIGLLITGSAAERVMAKRIAAGIGAFAYAAAGIFDLEEFAAVIANSQTLVSVNTGTIHLAAAVNKPLVVLYAQTNPQHAPWLVRHQLLEYSIPKDMQSKNQVIKFVNEHHYKDKPPPLPSAKEVVEAVKKILNSKE